MHWALGTVHSRVEKGSVSGLGKSWFQAFAAGLFLALRGTTIEQAWIMTTDVVGTSDGWIRIEDFLIPGLWPILPVQPRNL